MLPESMAPPLEHYDEFKAFMAERNIQVIREYIPPFEDPETGESLGDFWAVVMRRETLMPDGRYWARMVSIGEKLTDWRQAWASNADLFEMQWQRDAEENGFTP